MAHSLQADEPVLDVDEFSHTQVEFSHTQMFSDEMAPVTRFSIYGQSTGILM